uniref:Uncharacterized protein n=1 Tax=Vespula pensylvanica TaxID=30213 RepID=A0A834UB23_VESPE|nr:hypothetical protein H0235_006867 [Vespula pensylvanica]
MALFQRQAVDVHPPKVLVVGRWSFGVATVGLRPIGYPLIYPEKFKSTSVTCLRIQQQQQQQQQQQELAC